MSCVPLNIVDHRHSGVLEIGWADGQTSRLPHQLLRAQCRCGGCEQLRRHGPGLAEADPQLRVAGIEAVGVQGLSLSFSDGHARGIYPWSYLRALGAH